MRIDQLTFTRFLAAVSIVIFHYGGKSFIFNHESVAFIFRGADVGVSYFFILSGFVMMIAYGNKLVINATEYFRNRFARIYPLFFLGILMVLFQQILTKNIDFLGMFLNVFMIQAWIPGKVLSFNSPGWSLSVEFIFYAIFPFVFIKIFKKIPFKQFAFYVILLWIFSQIAFNVLMSIYGKSNLTDIKDILNYNPLMHVNQFLIGNLAGIFYLKNLQYKRGNYDFPILIFAGLVILALKFPMNLNFHNGLLAVFFIPLILLISLNDGFITKLFQKKPFVFLGEISYGIYILQYPIYSLISAYSVNKYLHISDVTAVFFIRLAILIVFSAFAYIYIEKPMQEKLKSRKKLVSISQNPV